MCFLIHSLVILFISTTQFNSKLYFIMAYFIIHYHKYKENEPMIEDFLQVKELA